MHLGHISKQSSRWHQPMASYIPIPQIPGIWVHLKLRSHTLVFHSQVLNINVQRSKRHTRRPENKAMFQLIYWLKICTAAENCLKNLLKPRPPTSKSKPTVVLTVEASFTNASLYELMHLKQQLGLREQELVVAQIIVRLKQQLHLTEQEDFTAQTRQDFT